MTHSPTSTPDHWSYEYWGGFLLVLEKTRVLPLDASIGPDGRVGDEVEYDSHPRLVLGKVVVVLRSQGLHLYHKINVLSSSSFYVWI